MTATAGTATPYFTISDPKTRKTLMGILWPLAIGLMLYRVFIQAVNGHVTNDFVPVYDALRRFIENSPVYIDNYSFTNPHYLYAPSASLLLSPFALFNSFTFGRWIFIGFNAVCIVIASYLLVKLLGYSWKSPLLPALLLASFLTEGVTNTLVFSNINGFIYLCEVAFLLLLWREKNSAAGIVLGLSIAIKPMLAPLLLIPLLLKRWRPFVGAIAVPVVLNLIAWPLSADAGAFFKRTMPYLGAVRDYYNNSIAGWLAYWGLPEPFIWVVRISVVVLGLVTIFLLQPYRQKDQKLWILTVSGVILLIAFLGGSLGQRYYSIMLIPLIATILLKGTMIRPWPAWIAVYLILDGSRWYSNRWYIYGRWIEYSRATIGWLLLLLVIFFVVLWRTLVAKRLNDHNFPMNKKAYLW
ncbi:MAG: glycosyltransferase family 87 protein [Lawsonella sp.]